MMQLWQHVATLHMLMKAMKTDCKHMPVNWSVTSKHIQTEPMEDADDAWQVEREYFEEVLPEGCRMLWVLCLAIKLCQKT